MCAMMFFIQGQCSKYKPDATVQRLKTYLQNVMYGTFKKISKNVVEQPAVGGLSTDLWLALTK